MKCLCSIRSGLLSSRHLLPSKMRTSFNMIRFNRALKTGQIQDAGIFSLNLLFSKQDTFMHNLAWSVFVNEITPAEGEKLHRPVQMLRKTNPKVHSFDFFLHLVVI